MILLPSASYNRYLRNFICLPRATGCADRICSFKGSAGLPEKEPLRLNDTYYNDPDIKPQTNLTSQQLIKFGMARDAGRWTIFAKEKPGYEDIMFL